MAVELNLTVLCRDDKELSVNETIWRAHSRMLQSRASFHAKIDTQSSAKLDLSDVSLDAAMIFNNWCLHVEDWLEDVTSNNIGCCIRLASFLDTESFVIDLGKNARYTLHYQQHLPDWLELVLHRKTYMLFVEALIVMPREISPKVYWYLTGWETRTVRLLDTMLQILSVSQCRVSNLVKMLLYNFMAPVNLPDQPEDIQFFFADTTNRKTIMRLAIVWCVDRTSKASLIEFWHQNPDWAEIAYPLACELNKSHLHTLSIILNK